MNSLYKKAIPFFVVTLFLGAWNISPKGVVAQVNSDATSSCDHGSTFLVGRTADLPHVKERIHDICNFRVNLDKVPKNVSEFDKDFISDSITENTLEIQSLQFSFDHATNEEWKGQIQMMLAMHTNDLNMAIAVAKKIGVSTKPDLTNASVYPETPDYDLGKRVENLVDEYLNPLMNTTGVDFNILSIDIIDDEHVADVQGELVAERLVKNSELKAFSKHSADTTELHLLVMGDLKHRLVDNYAPPPPDFQANYQNPRKFLP
jgi:hypothetical protein